MNSKEKPMNIEFRKIPIIVFAQCAVAFAAPSASIANEDNEFILRELSLSMNAHEVRAQLEDSGASCLTLVSEEGITQFEGANATICFKIENFELAKYKLERLSDLDKQAGRLIKEIGLHENFLEFIENPQVHQAYIDIIASLEGLYELTEIVIYAETPTRKSMFFSCYYFSSCNKPSTQVLSIMKSQIRYNFLETQLNRPPMLSDAYQFMLERKEIYDLISTIKLMPAIQMGSPNFTEELTLCLFKGLDRFCLYDGYLEFKLLQILTTEGYPPKTLQTINFLSNLILPVNGFWLERSNHNTGVPSFR